MEVSENNAMLSNAALIIFAKDPRSAQVKTRLAAGIGEPRAREVYRALLKHTAQVTSMLPVKKFVYYAGSLGDDDFSGATFEKRLQNGSDLGERMSNAFEEMVSLAQKIVIIGTDCPEITQEIIASAFTLLDSNDIVVGPAFDGGYYLLGMCAFHPWLFEDMPWSTPEVFMETVARCHEKKLKLALLPILHDVDKETDLQYLNEQILIDIIRTNI